MFSFSDLMKHTFIINKQNLKNSFVYKHAKFYKQNYFLNLNFLDRLRCINFRDNSCPLIQPTLLSSMKTFSGASVTFFTNLSACETNGPSMVSSAWLID